MIKYTTHYICYLNENNMVHCAKCRITGKFVKRAIAQNEYSLEYSVVSTYFSFFYMLYMFIAMLLNKPKSSVYDELTTLNKAMNIAYKQHDYVLFKQLNRQRFELINRSI